MSNNEKYREAYDMLCEFREGIKTFVSLRNWNLTGIIPCHSVNLSKWLLDNKGIDISHKSKIYLQDLQEAIDDQKVSLYNPVKNISRSKYERCTKNYNGVDLYKSRRSGCVWMYKSFCNKYYYWTDYNAKNQVIYFRGEVDWVKDNYEVYEAKDTTACTDIIMDMENWHPLKNDDYVPPLKYAYKPCVSFSVAEDAFDTGYLGREEEYVEVVECPEADKLITPVTEWTDKHYDLNYTLTEEDIEQGFVKLDVYKVAKVWRTGSKDDSGALWHSLKTIARFGEKNTVEREVKALYEQVKGLAREHGVELDG